jgi:selenocysteine lyase/cysteine desulfurase
MGTVYLDHAATSFPKAPGVAQHVAHALSSPTGNPGRSADTPSVEASRLMHRVRSLAAEFFNVDESKHVIFTSGATEGLNCALHGLLEPSGTVVTTPIEHNAVARPLRTIRAHITTVQADDQGIPDLDAVYTILKRRRPELFIFNAESNVTGAISPVQELIEVSEALEVPYLIDGSQLTGDQDIDLSSMRHGMFCCSAHKGLLGPTGVGFMIVSEQLRPRSLIQGGTGSDSGADLQPSFLPDSYESGTPNIHGIAGMEPAFRYLLDNNMEIYQAKSSISAYMFSRLHSLQDDVAIQSPLNNRGSIVSFSPKHMDMAEVSYRLTQQKIIHRMGMHCAPWAHNHIGTYTQGGTIRFSVGHTTTKKEIDVAIEILKEIIHG